MSLEARLRRLEARCGAGQRCPSCGLGDLRADAAAGRVVFEFGYTDEPREAQYCQACGRATVIVVDLGDDSAVV